jgi:hypothetical protein
MKQPNYIRNAPYRWVKPSATPNTGELPVRFPSVIGHNTERTVVNPKDLFQVSTFLNRLRLN